MYQSKNKFLPLLAKVAYSVVLVIFAMCTPKAESD